MIIVCHAISQDHGIQKSCDFPGYSLSWYVKTLPSSVATGNAAVEMFLVAEEEDSRCSRFNSPLLFISKRHGFKSLNISY